MPSTVTVVVDGANFLAQEVPSGCTVRAWKELLGRQVHQTGRITCRAERGGPALPDEAPLPRPPAKLHVDGPQSVLKLLVPALRRPTAPLSARGTVQSARGNLQSVSLPPGGHGPRRGASPGRQATRLRQGSVRGNEETTSALDSEAAATVLSFWFNELTPDDWFRRSYEHCDRVRVEFTALHARAAAGELAGWMDTPESCLALVILLDQISRFLYCGEPEEKAWDPQARLAATVALQRGDDRLSAPGPRRIALYLPFMHSEDAADKRRFTSLMRNGLGGRKGAWELPQGAKAQPSAEDLEELQEAQEQQLHRNGAADSEKPKQKLLNLDEFQVPSLPTLTMNHEHSKRFRSMKLDPQTQQAYQRDRKEINRSLRYQCLVCAVTHEFGPCRIG